MDQMLLNKVDEWLAAHRQEIIDDLIGLVRIPSVSVPDEVVPPFGQACRDALAYMYELGKKHGYTSQDYDHYVGSVTFTTGEEKVGIWAHWDVVPVPDPAEWDYPPFEGTLVENRYLIGRGVQDNKMAAIGVFHVMNCLRDLGVKLRRSYSLYMGTSEETGMEDARYFTAHYPAPDLSIVPDTGFPVCCAQRGSMTLSVEVPFAHEVTIQQSNNPSVTPEEITAVLADGTALTAKGDSAHIFKADGIDNAIVKLLKLLGERFPEDAEKRQIMLDTVFRSPCWVMLDRGTLSQEEAVKAMAGLHPELENDIRYVLENWIDLKDVVQEGVDTLKRCKAMGKRCIVLSNYHDESFKHVQRKFDFFRLMDGFVISAEVHMVKPCAEIYHYLLDHFHLDGERTLFIDDAPANIEAALHCGIQGICFNKSGKLHQFFGQ